MKINKASPPGRFKYDWVPIAEAADASPGEWIAPEQEFPHSVVAMLQRGGRNTILPTDKYEFKTSATRYDIDGKRWCIMHVRRIPERESNA